MDRSKHVALAGAVPLVLRVSARDDSDDSAEVVAALLMNIATDMTLKRPMSEHLPRVTSFLKSRPNSTQVRASGCISASTGSVTPTPRHCPHDEMVSGGPASQQIADLSNH
jgi:hypothetical protein